MSKKLLFIPKPGYNVLLDSGAIVYGVQPVPNRRRVWAGENRLNPKRPARHEFPEDSVVFAQDPLIWDAALAVFKQAQLDEQAARRDLQRRRENRG